MFPCTPTVLNHYDANKTPSGRSLQSGNWSLSSPRHVNLYTFTCSLQLISKTVDHRPPLWCRRASGGHSHAPPHESRHAAVRSGSGATGRRFVGRRRFGKLVEVRRLCSSCHIGETVEATEMVPLESGLGLVLV